MQRIGSSVAKNVVALGRRRLICHLSNTLLLLSGLALAAQDATGQEEQEQISDDELIERVLARLRGEDPDNPRPPPEIRVDEELVTTAQRLPRAATELELVNLSKVGAVAARLYKQGKYKEALPLLEEHAKMGFKMSQARLGAIYLYGLGDVPVNQEKGFGWMGIAAIPDTDPVIRNQWKQVLKALTPSARDQVEDIVSTYELRYGEIATGTRCDMVKREASNLRYLDCQIRNEFLARSMEADSQLYCMVRRVSDAWNQQPTTDPWCAGLN